MHPISSKQNCCQYLLVYECTLKQARSVLSMLVRSQVLLTPSQWAEGTLACMNRLTDAVKWSMCLHRILHYSGSLLVASLGFAQH